MKKETVTKFLEIFSSSVGLTRNRTVGAFFPDVYRQFSGEGILKLTTITQNLYTSTRLLERSFQSEKNLRKTNLKFNLSLNKVWIER